MTKERSKPRGLEFFLSLGHSVESIRRRVDSKIDKSRDGCWPWMGTRGNVGKKKSYGYLKQRVEFGPNGTKAQIRVTAHRLAYELENGPLPPGKIVLHKCNNPPCCNPSHLEMGTNAGNSQYMVDCGRSLSGERHPQARITAEQARRICRRYYEGGETQKAIGFDYGPSQISVSLIVRGERWGSETFDLREKFEEREAIMEYEGGMSREQVEEEALALVRMDGDQLCLF